MPCEITRYRCPEDEAHIRNLGHFADAQQGRNSGFDTRVLPWKDGCKHTFQYVARDTKTGTICGWLSASLLTFRKETYMLLSEISTRRIRNELYGGIGQALHAAMLADAVRLGAKFVYLYPLTSEVREIYKQPAWGYVELRPHVSFLFRILTGEPSRQWWKEFSRPDPIQQAMNISKRDIPLRKQIVLMEPVVRGYPEIVIALCEEMDAMEGAEASNSEKKEGLRSFFFERIFDMLEDLRT